MIDPRQGAECERSDGILRTREFDSAAVDGNEVRRTARHQATDVIAPQELRSVSGRHLEHGPRAEEACVIFRGHSRQQNGGTNLGQQVRGVIGRRSVDPQANHDRLIEIMSHRRDPGAEAHIGTGAVADPAAAASQDRNIVRVKMHAMREPGLCGQAAELLRHLHGPFPVLMQREIDLACCLAEMEMYCTPFSAASTAEARSNSAVADRSELGATNTWRNEPGRVS